MSGHPIPPEKSIKSWSPDYQSPCAIDSIEFFLQHNKTDGIVCDKNAGPSWVQMQSSPNITAFAQCILFGQDWQRSNKPNQGDRVDFAGIDFPSKQGQHCDCRCTSNLGEPSILSVDKADSNGTTQSDSKAVARGSSILGEGDSEHSTLMPDPCTVDHAFEDKKVEPSGLSEQNLGYMSNGSNQNFTA